MFVRVHGCVREYVYTLINVSTYACIYMCMKYVFADKNDYPNVCMYIRMNRNASRPCRGSRKRSAMLSSGAPPSEGADSYIHIQKYIHT